jgi:hypothetical protein
LVRGVERRCALATDPDPFEGRPLGLYGNRFARAKEDAIRRAVTVLTPPTISNILAMSAPPGGTDRYTEAEIRDILVTAYTGFRAARLEAEVAAGATSIVVHTGHWGTGAFGGNKVLMSVLQMVAARLAGISRLIYHTVDATASEPYQEGKHRVDGLLPPAGAMPSVADLVRAVHEMGFTWGRVGRELIRRAAPEVPEVRGADRGAAARRATGCRAVPVSGSQRAIFLAPRHEVRRCARWRGDSVSVGAITSDGPSGRGCTPSGRSGSPSAG